MKSNVVGYVYFIILTQSIYAIMIDVKSDISQHKRMYSLEKLYQLIWLYYWWCQ
jgi:hypothetical protein